MTRLPLVVGATIVVQGCFLSSGPYVAPTAAELPGLRARVDATPRDIAARSELAGAHLARGEADAAISLLTEAGASAMDDPAAPLLLAIARERSGDRTAAREEYRRYRDSRIGLLSRRADERLAVIQADLLRLDARELLALPLDELGSTDPDRIVILPFAHPGADSEAEALVTAVAELVSWDLSETGRQATSDAFVRTLLTELGADSDNRAELSLGVEVGRRLQAGRVVQGTVRRVGLDLVVWDVTVMTITGESSLELEQVTFEGGVNQALLMERRTSAVIRRTLAGQSTGVRYGSIPDWTTSAAALRAFGAGRLAMDRGDWAEAYESMAAAAALDHDFAEAGRIASGLEPLVAIPGLDALVEEVIRVGALQRGVARHLGTPSPALQSARGRVGSPERPVLADILGLDALNAEALLDVGFQLPGVGP